MENKKIIEEILKKNPEMNKENLVFRLDGRIEYECEHDVGHPVYSPDGDYLHGCCTDRCCENYNLVFPKDFED